MLFVFGFCCFFGFFFPSQRKISSLCSDEAYQCSFSSFICSSFICRTERSAHRALPAGPRRLHVGNLEPEEVEQKPKGLEERRAVPNAKELKSHRLSLPTRHLCMALWQSLPLVGRALLWCGTRNKHGSAQRSYAGSDLSWSCRDKHTGLKWMGCDCIASLVHIPRALKGIFFW